jgi:hypothetical protein
MLDAKQHYDKRMVQPMGNVFFLRCDKDYQLNS